jgi:hypothetical protein
LEIRIAVVGNVDSGKVRFTTILLSNILITFPKSTLLGVLTRGQLDNGRGLARMSINISPLLHCITCDTFRYI